MTHRPGGTGARGPKRPWTDTDVATLAQLKSAHTPTAEVARHLGRTFASVELKVTALRARGALPLGRCPIRVHRPLEAAVTAKAEGPRTRVWEEHTRTITVDSTCTPRHAWKIYYHELAHVALDDSGLSNGIQDDLVEALCDALSVARMREKFG